MEEVAINTSALRHRADMRRRASPKGQRQPPLPKGSHFSPLVGTLDLDTVRSLLRPPRRTAAAAVELVQGAGVTEADAAAGSALLEVLEPRLEAATARGVHPNTNQAANMAETMTGLSECDNLTDIAPKRMPCSHFNNESTQCQKHRVGKSPCVHAHGLCRRAAVPSCMPSLVQQIRPSSPQFDGTPSAHLYLWLNFTSARDLCEASNAFRHISAAIQHASHSTLRRWYPMRAASTSRVKPRMQLAAGPPVTSTIAALASRLLSPPAMLLGRFGNVEMLSAMRIADGGHPPSWLRDYAGFYSGTSNTSSELAFQRAYVRAARASDKVMLVVEQHSLLIR